MFDETTLDFSERQGRVVKAQVPVVFGEASRDHL